jgi:chain length determinant protein tyrosine kinase EpsG
MSESNVQPLNTSKNDAVSETSLGMLLMESGTLTEADIERVLLYAKDRELRFGDAAIKLGLAARSDIQHALARQFEYPFLKPGVGGYGKELVAAYKPFTPRVEAMRALRMQLMLRWFAAGNSTLAIISAGAREGRTYLAANLAIVFSQLGDRTLLIDANLQNGRLHKVFRVDNEPGLSPALVGRTGGKLSVQKAAHFENLWVLPAGAVPPNPEELLARNEFEEILTKVGSQYDTVLVDTPPGSSGIGAETVAYRCKGALLVTRRNRTVMNDVKKFTERLQGRAEIVGAVLNSF